MEYRNYGGTYYIRMDKGDEMIGLIMEICRKEGIRSAVYTGIGGCGSAEIQTYIADRNEFETERIEGTLELISFTGNVITGDEGQLYHHTHALFSYVKDGEHRFSGGHMKEVSVLYTAEVELRPVKDGMIGRKHDPETGTGFWDFR